jgi:hypothetical protein
LRRHLPAVLLASTIVGGCARTAETAADRRAEEIAIAMQIGAPLPDAIDTRTFWSAASQVPYSHRLDIDAIDQWYADLPNRFECEPAETTPRSVDRERRPRWSLRCLVDEGAWWLVITADTSPSAGEAVTVVGAHHELKLAPTPTT